MSAEQYDSVLVVSDAHVGLGRDEVFKDEFEAFVKHLASREILEIESEEGRLRVEVPKAIVLLGDFVDLWDGRLSELPEFTARFGRLLADKADVFHLRGNHDYVVPNIQLDLAAADLKKIEICEYKLLEVGGESWFFIHGHQFMSAFGPVSLKLESYINPYYSLMEDFFSRLFPQDHRRGRQVVYSLTALFLLLCAILASGQPVVAEPTHGLILWVVFGMLLPLARAPPVALRETATLRKTVNLAALKGSELQQLFIAWLVLGFCFSASALFTPAAFPMMFAVSLITLGFGFVGHELAHRYMARCYGCHAEFRLWPLGLAMAVMFALVSGGRMIFAAPGAVYIMPRSFGFGYGITKRENGLISLSGPLANILVGLGFLVLAGFDGFLGLVGSTGFMVNFWLAAFNLLPFGMLDGRKVFSWSPAVWAAVTIPAWLIIFL